MKKGKFITFEGNEGSGKTTLSQKIFAMLQEEGVEVIYTREPGGIRIAEKIRDIILDREHTEMDARAEALLYAAARAQHLKEKVIPALEAGKVVLCDRFIDSSIAYQGVARGLGFNEILHLNEFAINGLMPHKTILLKIEPDLGLKRIENRNNLNRLDLEAINFHYLVAKGYDEVAEAYPERISVIDASKSIDDVYLEAKAIIEQVIND